MDTLNRIIDLIGKKGIGQKEFANDLSHLGFNKDTVTNWKRSKGKPYMKYIDSIADYFDVSVDYLLGKTDVSHIPKELKNAKVSFYEGAFEGLDQNDIKVLHDMAKRLREIPAHNRPEPEFGSREWLQQGLTKRGFGSFSEKDLEIMLKNIDSMAELLGQKNKE